jgi:prevent-host-death family protein
MQLRSPGGGPLAETNISIGQVKRDISELVNRVAYGRERIVLTSRGKPKAALVSIEDYEHLKAEEIAARQDNLEEWLAKRDELNKRILERRQGEPVDFNAIWQAVKDEEEERSDYLAGLTTGH